MKMSVRLTLILSLLSFAAFSNSRSYVELIQMGNKNLFVITSSKIDRGGEVYVLSSDGTLVITSQKIVKRRTVIDFHDIQSGTYTIVLKKGGHAEEFQFEKR